MNVTPSSRLTKDTIAQALEGCATEPVHIPGTVQPFGCLVCIDSDTGRINYASENCKEIIGLEAHDLFGEEFRERFGAEISHAVVNASATEGFKEKSTPLGMQVVQGKTLEVSGFASGSTFVIQFEAPRDPELGGGDTLNALTFLIQQIQACSHQDELLDLTTELLRHLTGYDRVMVYRFDTEFNGEVLAEARQRALESFIGLRFPHWDIPAQAREIMAKIPLRLIQDIDQSPVPLLAANADMPPLDTTYAECRGVSEVHMEYLRNMGIRASMTLTIKVDGDLWGIISFHHRRPRVPAPKTREVLCAFLEIFCSKLAVLRKEAQLNLAQRIDRLKDETLGSIENADSTSEIATAGPAILEAIQGDGLAVMTGSLVKRFGQIPDQAVLAHLSEMAHNNEEHSISFQSISTKFQHIATGCNGIAGALVLADGPGRTLFLFRREVATTVSWAGNPDKTIEFPNGSARLRPRGSFSLYLQEVQGNSKAWTDDDIAIAGRIWTLINSAERQELRNKLQKQQDLMISELNHRVRNILSLVRSVSRQARRHNSSLESYSESIERRIQSLAAAHDLASGAVRTAVSMRELIEIEVEPYREGNRVIISGMGHLLRADVAPIFSLVIHELATNAAKYGALSDENGKLSIHLSQTKTGVNLAWRENDGPTVVEPDSRGFGSTLIEQAVPYEMGGSSNLHFASTGVEADLFFPNAVLELDQSTTVKPGRKQRPIGQTEEQAFDPNLVQGLFLVIEDNFTIAQDIREQLKIAGVKDIEISSNASDAMNILDTETPSFALLDVNLGPGKTSEPVALRLLDEKVPFIFATGYGEMAELAPELSHVQRLTKPLITNDLLGAISSLLSRPDE